MESDPHSKGDEKAKEAWSCGRSFELRARVSGFLASGTHRPTANKLEIYYLLKEVVWGSSGNLWFTPARGRVKLKEGVPHLFIHLHDCRLVSTPIAVVGGAKNCDHFLFVAPVVAFHNKLMC